MRKRDSTNRPCAAAAAGLNCFQRQEENRRARRTALVVRCPRRKAILAIASSMLTAAYVMLRDGLYYHDLGPHHFEQRDKDRVTKRLLERLRNLGVTVEVTAA